MLSQMEGAEWTKVKYIHSRIPWETPLNIDLDTNKERQDCKIGTGCGSVCMGYLWEGRRWKKEIKVKEYDW
jgi:hypothetical protein